MKRVRILVVACAVLALPACSRSSAASVSSSATSLDPAPSTTDTPVDPATVSLPPLVEAEVAASRAFLAGEGAELAALLATAETLAHTPVPTASMCEAVLADLSSGSTPAALTAAATDAPDEVLSSVFFALVERTQDYLTQCVTNASEMADTIERLQGVVVLLRRRIGEIG